MRKKRRLYFALCSLRTPRVQFILSKNKQLITGASRWWGKAVDSIGPKQEGVAAPVEWGGRLARAEGAGPGLLAARRQAGGDGGQVAEVGEEEGRGGELLVLPGDPDLVRAVPGQGVEVVHENWLFKIFLHELVQCVQSVFVSCTHKSSAADLKAV